MLAAVLGMDPLTWMYFAVSIISVDSVKLELDATGYSWVLFPTTSVCHVAVAG